MRDVSKIHLHGVHFRDSDNRWRSPPAQFSGTPESYGQIVNSPHLQTGQSFSWMAAVLPHELHNGPLYNVDIPGSPNAFGHHIWMLESRLYFRTSCGVGVTHSVTMRINQWYTLAVAYDHIRGEYSAWLDGELQQMIGTACPQNMLISDTISMGKR